MKFPALDRMRKGNSAVFVNTIMPLLVGGGRRLRAITRIICVYSLDHRRNRIDSDLLSGIIDITSRERVGGSRIGGHREPAQGCQERIAAGIGGSQSAPPIGHGPVVSGTRVLRRAGFGAGQVRDAPPRADRRPVDHRGGAGLWILSAIVL